MNSCPTQPIDVRGSAHVFRRQSPVQAPERFGYTPGSFRGAMSSVSESSFCHRRPSYRQKIITLRKQNSSVYDIRALDR